MVSRVLSGVGAAGLLISMLAPRDPSVSKPLWGVSLALIVLGLPGFMYAKRAGAR